MARSVMATVISVDHDSHTAEILVRRGFRREICTRVATDVRAGDRVLVQRQTNNPYPIFIDRIVQVDTNRNMADPRFAVE